MNSATNAKKARKPDEIFTELTDEQRRRVDENRRRLSEYEGVRRLAESDTLHELPEHLKACLRAAVPLWVERVRTYSPERFQKRTIECADTIAEMSDAVEHKRSNTREAFNALAEGLALATIASGGVFEFEGMKFCYE